MAEQRRCNLIRYRETHHNQVVEKKPMFDYLKMICVFSSIEHYVLGECTIVLVIILLVCIDEVVASIELPFKRKEFDVVRLKESMVRTYLR